MTAPSRDFILVSAEPPQGHTLNPDVCEHQGLEARSQLLPGGTHGPQADGDTSPVWKGAFPP